MVEVVAGADDLAVAHPKHEDAGQNERLSGVSDGALILELGDDDLGIGGLVDGDVGRPTLQPRLASVGRKEVARLAGAGIATVFRHFPTKAALLQAVVVRRFDRCASRPTASRHTRTRPDKTAMSPKLLTPADSVSGSACVIIEAMGRRLALAVLVLALAACTSEPERPMSSPPAAPTVAPVAAPPVRTFNAPLSELGYLAVVMGVLVLTEGGCVALSDEGTSGGRAAANSTASERTSVVVWPPGITATADGVQVPGYGRFRFGERIRAGGGGFPWSAEDRGVPRVPRDCWGEEEPGGVTLVSGSVTRPH